MRTQPLIEVIIPNWNGRDMLLHCLDSLYKQSFDDFLITVVDNGSSDDSCQAVEEKYPQTKLIKLASNTGFSFAVNAGIKNAKGKLLLLLNNDMEVTPNCLEKLVEGVAKYPEFDFFALKMLSFTQREFIDGAGDAVLRGGVGYRLGTLERDGDRYSRDKETFGACGGAALYKRELFEQIGSFDQCFFAYLEDVDFNLRARRLHKKCMYLAEAVVYHIGSATTGSKFNRRTITLSTRNNFYVICKNYPFSLILRFFPAICIYQFMWLLFCIKKRMFLPYLSGLYEACISLPVLLKKRAKLLRQLHKKDIDRFAEQIISAEREAVQSIKARRLKEGKKNTVLDLYCRLFL